MIENWATQNENTQNQVRIIVIVDRSDLGVIPPLIVPRKIYMKRASWEISLKV